VSATILGGLTAGIVCNTARFVNLEFGRSDSQSGRRAVSEVEANFDFDCRTNSDQNVGFKIIHLFCCPDKKII
jgi:hypothetical protein